MNRSHDAAAQTDLHPSPSLPAMIGGIVAAAWMTARSLWRQRATALVPGITPDQIEPPVRQKPRRQARAVRGSGRSRRTARS